MSVPRLAPAMRLNAEGIPDLALLSDGNIDFVHDGEAVAQHVQQRLLSFEDEWFMDTTAGTLWLEEILGRQFNAALADSVVKAEILATDGVLEIDAFTVSYKRDPRGLELNGVVISTEYDEGIVGL